MTYSCVSSGAGHAGQTGGTVEAFVRATIQHGPVRFGPKAGRAADGNSAVDQNLRAAAHRVEQRAFTNLPLKDQKARAAPRPPEC